METLCNQVGGGGEPWPSGNRSMAENAEQMALEADSVSNMFLLPLTRSESQFRLL